MREEKRSVEGHKAHAVPCEGSAFVKVLAHSYSPEGSALGPVVLIPVRN